MSSIGGGSIGSSGRSLIIIIPAGKKAEWENVYGFKIASIDSSGNIRHKGFIGRTKRP